jgi:DNA-binding XRE family transcriptional regulator
MIERRRDMMLARVVRQFHEGEDVVTLEKALEAQRLDGEPFTSCISGDTVPIGTVGMKVKRLRAARGWTQAELAKRAKVARVSIARLETSPKSRRPALRTIERLAKALGVPVAELLE